MATLALVHGAFHGGWCWDRLRPELEAIGHRTVAMDLPIDDPQAGNAAYSEAVVSALAEHPEPVVMVGHSLAGLTIPLVAAARPVERMVFLCAFIPQPGRAFREQFSEEAGMFPPGGDPADAPIYDEATGIMTWPAERIRRAMYSELDAETAAWAAARIRPQSDAPHKEVCPLDRWPDVPSSYILARGDSSVGAEWARRAARARLDTTALELPGEHMPMLSRPAELARLLDQAVQPA